MFNELQDVKHRVGKVEESNERIYERLEQVEKGVKLNTDSLGSLTKELQEVKHIEFNVYNHEERIKKLEKAR